MREVLVHLARMHRAARADEVQQRAHVPAARRGPGRRTAARVHQRLHGAGDEAVVHEEVLVDVEAGIAALEIAGAVAGHAMAQREVLRARRRPDRVGLHEAERVERALQRGRREEAARDRRAPQVVERHSDPLCVVSETSRANRARRFSGAGRPAIALSIGLASDRLCCHPDRLKREQRVTAIPSKFI